MWNNEISFDELHTHMHIYLEELVIIQPVCILSYIYVKTMFL